MGYHTSHNISSLRCTIAQFKQKGGLAHTTLSEKQRATVTRSNGFPKPFHKILYHAVTTDILFWTIAKRRLE